MQKEDLTQPVTKEYLGHFTETILLPAIGAMIKPLESRLDKVKQRITALEGKIEALDAKLTNYLELSDKRYLELNGAT